MWVYVYGIISKGRLNRKLRLNELSNKQRETVGEEKTLGVIIDSILSFDSHIFAKIKKRATRMVQGLQTLRYNVRLKKQDLPSLKYRRRRRTRIEMFKIGYNLSK